MELEFVSDTEVGTSELFVYFDEEGKQTLLKALEDATKTGHDHLFVPDWGGQGLTVSTDQGAYTYKKVTLTFSQRVR